MNNRKEKIIILILGLFAIGFGIITIKSGGFALFGGEAGKEFAGKYVPFVLWFNFLAGFLYVVTGVGILLKKKWSVVLAKTLATSTVLIFMAFGIYILTGGEYEMRTIGAMTVRSLFWIVISLLTTKAIKRG